MTIGHVGMGQGPEKVIVLHGWMGDHTVYTPLFPWLDLDAFSFVFMDCRGYGRSRDLPGEHTMAEWGEDVIGLADDQGWDRFHIVGHSMGGMATQWVAAEVPHRVTSAVAITPVPASGVPFAGDALDLFSTAWERRDNRAMILALTTGDRLGALWRDTMAERSMAQCTPQAYRDYFHAWSGSNFADRVRGLETPFKVIVGRHDPAITEDAMRATLMQWLPKAELEVFADAGHYPMQECPPLLAQSIQEFLRRCSGT
ncbi:alpha/beta fold hydrolase [Novispirillum sp. DQ9]|uniref:alpha/beta fold hydrolase n=1 Tax=Novispirillum sp. DQ9 TaxID=3398612 RepID=UPI003C7D159F